MVIKMKTLFKVLSVLTIAVSATAAQAQLYGEIAYVPLTVTTPFHANNVKASPSAIGLTLGYDIHPYFSVEAMAAIGAGDDQVDVSGLGAVTVKVDNSYGMFVKPKYMLNDKFEVFGRLGYLKTEYTASNSAHSVTESKSGAAYGVGANYYFTPKTYANVSYMNFYDKDNTTVEGVTLGLGMKF